MENLEPVIGGKIVLIDQPNLSEWLRISIEGKDGKFHLWTIRCSGAGGMQLDGVDVDI
jgi:hypothetical protein